MTNEAASMGDRKALRALAADELSQRAVTAFIVSGGGPRQSVSVPPSDGFIAAWLEAVEESAVSPITGADRLAWAAYSAGNFRLTQRWMKQADPASPITLWVRAKLLLLTGRTAEAAEVLAKTVRAFPPNETWNDRPVEYDDFGPYSPSATARRTRHEKLSRRQYVDALDALHQKRRLVMDAA